MALSPTTPSAPRDDRDQVEDDDRPERQTPTAASGWVRRISSVGSTPRVTTRDATGHTTSSRNTASSTAVIPKPPTSAQSRQVSPGGSGTRGVAQRARTARLGTYPA